MDGNSEDAMQELNARIDRFLNDPYGMFPGLPREQAEERIRDEWAKLETFAEENGFEFGDEVDERMGMVDPLDALRLERINDNDPDLNPAWHRLNGKIDAFLANPEGQSEELLRAEWQRLEGIADDLGYDPESVLGELLYDRDYETQTKLKRVFFDDPEYNDGGDLDRKAFGA